MFCSLGSLLAFLPVCSSGCTCLSPPHLCLSTHLSTCQSAQLCLISLSICVSLCVCVSVNLSECLFTYMTVICRFAFMLVSRSVWLLHSFIPLSTVPSIHMPTYLFIRVKIARESLYLSQVAHPARGYSGLLSVKQLGVLLLFPGCDTSAWQGYP